MKKKYVFVVVAILMIVIGAMLLKPLGIISMKENEFVFNDDCELQPFESAEFYINVTDENGENHRINIDFEGDGHKYAGTAYLPGFADSENCFVSWESDADVTVQKRLKNYNSGEFAIAGDDYAAIYFVKADGKKYDFMLKTEICSPAMRTMFINIDESEGSINDMKNDPDHETSCYGEVMFDGTKEYISIKGRGNATWGWDKKPYNITFLEKAYDGKKKVELIDGVKTRKWSLLANYLDPTLMRNYIGYNLSDKLGIGLKSDYFDVWMNGDYLGNYLITPKNDYMAQDEGFILELDNYIDEEDPQFYLSNENGQISTLLFTIKDDSADLGTAEIQNWMQETWNAIEDFDSENYQNYIDVESWAKMYLLHELFKNFDVVNGSILMHRDGTSSEDKLIAGPMWDLDSTMGISLMAEDHYVSSELMNSANYWYIDSINMKHNNRCWLQELGKHESFRAAVKDVYNAYKLNFDEMVNDVDKAMDKLGVSALREFDKWNDTEKRRDNFYIWEQWKFDEGTPYAVEYNLTSDYYEYVFNLKAYLKARLAFLEDNLAE